MKQSIAGIIYQDGKFLIGKRLNQGEMASRWEFPGGKVDQGETPEQAIRREFLEEMNVPVEPLDFLTEVQFVNKSGPVSLLAYLLKFPEKATLTLSEHTETSWATFSEIKKLNFVDSDMLLFPFLEDWLKKENHENK